ncbi:EAL domain protein [Shewanella piezotolerans WP3]|uniref:EAL domain protein n=1 Tax=Shewanella piezotolerans (strain WP3 / JCM 13877) TaxID=225849 RepID=B8CUT1_SHEPW|nr:EAL domain-containing protein [Shewanella piezotolerans]ACJ31407.1 EAL domain protein [Shewanella piezotolerans WP3]
MGQFRSKLFLPIISIFIGAFSLMMLLSYAVAYWRVTLEVTSDAEQMVNYVEHKLNYAMRNIFAVEQLHYERCDDKGRAELERFLLHHFNGGLFFVRSNKAKRFTYCSVVGEIVVAKKDRNFENLILLDEVNRQFPLAVLNYNWKQQDSRSLFLGYTGKRNTSAIRITLDDGYAFFEPDCTKCRHVEIKLNNDSLVYSMGQPLEGLITTIRIESDRYPFYVASQVNRNRILVMMKNGVVFSLPVSLLVAFLCAYLFKLLKRSERSLKQRLKRAIRQRELIAFYQPIMDAATGRIVGAEALVRWLRPNGEVISPARFIDELERTALINPLTIQMLEQIPEDLKSIFASDGGFRCSLNLVPEQVEQEDFCRHVELLAASGFPTQQIAVEITERLPLRNLEVANQHLERLKALGVMIELDDAGTGYGGASYLQELNIDILKIDKLFVDTLVLSPDNTPVLDAYIQMAKTLEMEVIAEGVEKQKQSLALLARGVHLHQGYYFSKPLPAEEFVRFWLSKQN